MQLTLILAIALPVWAAETPGASLSALFKRVSSYLNAPAVKRSPRLAAVAAVRGGIPTEQGENLDLRLLDRARALRAALRRPDAAPADEKALRPLYQALAASQYVQALSLLGATAGRREAAQALENWARRRRSLAPPRSVLALLQGPPVRIDDKTLVAAGWGRHVRALTPADTKTQPAVAGWLDSAQAALLDETLKSLSDSWLEHKLTPEDEAQAHLLAGQAYAALAVATFKARPPESAAAVAAPTRAGDDEPAPAPVDLPFDPKTLYQRAAPGVALILCSSPEGTGELGTGSVVDAGRRLLLTNAHVVVRDSSRRPWPSVRLYFKPAKMSGDPKRDLVDPVEGKVMFWDSALDLALIEAAQLPPGTPAIALGHPGAVSIGDRVAAIGHPEQGGLWTLTTGVISARLAELGGVAGRDAFQTDASINRGNSGGPLLDAAGHMVGVNTLMSRKAADGMAITAVNFAVRSDVARRWLAEKDLALAYRVADAAPGPAPAPASPLESSTPVAAAAEAPTLMLTESRPFDQEDLIKAEIARMEDLGREMHEEIRRKLGR